MNVIYAPTRRYPPAGQLGVFLAGSIDMGNAVEWQKHVEEKLKCYGVTLYNPRRHDWDASWVQELENDQFSEQVNWELDYLQRAEIVLMHITKDSKAPITLMEFGMIAHTAPAKLIISVEPGFWRRGNIEVVCNRHGIPLYESIDDSIEALIERLYP